MKGVVIIPQDDDTRVSILVGALIAYQMVNWTVNSLVNRFISVAVWWDSAFVLCMLLGVILYSARAIIRRQDSKTFLLYAFFVFCFALSIFLNLPGASYAKKNFFTFFFTVLSYYLVGRSIYDFNKLKPVVIIASKVSVVSSIIWLVLYFSTSSNGWNNCMAVSYSVLPSICILGYAYFSNRKLINIFWFIAGILTILFMGTRGPMIILVIYIIFMFLYFSRSNYKFFVASILLIVGILVYNNMNSILSYLLKHFSVGETTNAAFYKFLNSEDITNGRILIYEKVWAFCKENIMLGHGVYGEWSIIGGYAHLMPLEMITHYGIILGSIFFVYILIKNIKYLSANKNNDFSYFFCLTIVGVGFFKLLFSGSYLQESYFWLLLGMVSKKKCLVINGEKKY